MGLQIQNFCGCCSLRTGSLIIGTAGWILTMLELFARIDTAINRRDAKNATSFDNINISTLSNADLDIDEDNILADESWNFHNEEVMFYIGYAVVSLIVCVLLVWGVYKKDKRFILPWLVLKCIEAVIKTILVFLILVLAFRAPPNATGTLFLFFLLLLFVSALVWYFWICVWSHYMELGEGGCSHSGAVLGPPPVYYTTAVIPPPQYTEKNNDQLA